MTSAVGGGGFPKYRQKEQNQLICDSDKGGGSKKNQNILQTSCMEAPLREIRYKVEHTQFILQRCHSLYFYSYT